METLELKKFYKNKKVFITGHTGFKGSWLILLLNKLGAKICGYALAPNTEPNLFNLIKGSSFIEHHEGDIRDYEHLLSVMQKFQPEIVLHLAAQAIVLTSYNEPRLTYDINVMGTVNILEAVRHTKSVKSVVNVTTDKVYLNNDSGSPFVETDVLCGYDPYSNSKSCSELVTYSYQHAFFNLKDYNKHHVTISTCRAGNVIGGGDWGEYRLIPDCIRNLIKDEPIIIRNPNSTRPFQHVLEPLYLYLKIAKEQYNDINFSGNYNIGPNIENCVSVKNIIDSFIKYQPRAKFIIQQNADAKHEAAKLSLDNTKVIDLFNYKTIYTIDETIKTIVDFTNSLINKQDMKMIAEDQILDFFAKIDAKEK